MEKWKIPLERLRITEFNLSVGKANWFVIGLEQVEDTKIYNRGSIKDMQSLWVDPEKNVPLEEERLGKVGSERVSKKMFVAFEMNKS